MKNLIRIASRSRGGEAQTSIPASGVRPLASVRDPLRRLLLLLFLLIPSCHALFAQTPSANAANSPYAVGARDGDSSVWERTTCERAPDGRMVSRLHRYTELGTGLNHLVNGQWIPSSEEIDILPDGTAAATRGQHQAYFPGDIYQGQIELVTPDGLHLKSRPLGLSYDDGTNSVLIAELTNSAGELASSNQVVYPNAFTGLAADLRYTYTKAGFEQDVILREQPPAPASLGLNPGTTRLQVLTEFFNPPPPSTAGDGTADESLGFGAMQMGHGKAFLLGASSPPVRVDKQWVQLSGRQFLVESVATAAMGAQLESLPLPAAQTSSTATLRAMAGHLALPPPRLAKNVPAARPRLLAKTAPPTKGLVLDYVTLNSAHTNYTFLADTTYYISGAIGLSGATNTIEGGAVLKFPGSGLRGNTGITLGNGFGGAANLASAAGPHHMAVLTSKDDDSAGESVSGSTGSPTNGATAYLEFYLNSTTPPSVLDYLRFAYAGTAITYWSEATTATNVAALNDCQFLNCGTAVQLGDYDNLNVLNQRLGNVLFSHCGTAVMNIEAPYYESDIGVTGVNVTADQVTNLVWTWSGDDALYQGLTNGILTAVVNQVYYEDTYAATAINTNACYVTNNSAGIYATGPLGGYYLPTNSPLIDAGNETAAAAGFADATTQTNQVQDTGAVDLGYHYPAAGADSTGTDFWLAFFNMPTETSADPYTYAILRLYISSPVATTATVTYPVNGSTLTITGDTNVNNVNGTYVLTTNVSESASQNVDAVMYVNSTNSALQVVSRLNEFYWQIWSYDSGSDTVNQYFYEKNDFSLGGSNWLSDASDSFDPALVVSCPQVPFSRSFSLAPGMVTNAAVPLNLMLFNYDAVEGKGIHVTAGQPVSVYGFYYLTTASTAFTAYPTTLLGTNYCVMARASSDNFSGACSQFAIVATASNTTVTIMPSATANLIGHTNSYTITNLQQGETYQINSSDYTGDVTGTRITSDKPVAVFAGANYALVPDGNTASANPLLQEQLPVADWGTNVLTLGFAFRTNGDCYRILSAESNTVTITGTVVTPNESVFPYTVTTTNETVVTNLAAGTFCDIILEGPAQFQSAKPIQVAQFANGNSSDALSGQIGDPCELLLPPTGDYLTSYTVATPSYSDIDTNYVAFNGYDSPLFATNYLNLIIPQSAIPATVVDGVPVASTNFVTIGGSGYYGAQIPVMNGAHTVSSSQPVEVQVYGFDVTDAYGYFGGVVK